MIKKVKDGMEFVPDSEKVTGRVFASKKKIEADLKFKKPEDYIDAVREEFSAIKKWDDETLILANVAHKIFQFLDKGVKAVKIKYDLEKLKGEALKFYNKRAEPLPGFTSVIVAVGSIRSVVVIEPGRIPTIKDGEIYNTTELKSTKERLELVLDKWPVAVISKGSKTIADVFIGVTPKGNVLLIPTKIARKYDPHSLMARLDTIKHPYKGVALELEANDIGRGEVSLSLSILYPKGICRREVLWEAVMKDRNVLDIYGDESIARAHLEMLFGQAIRLPRF